MNEVTKSYAQYVITLILERVKSLLPLNSFEALREKIYDKSEYYSGKFAWKIRFN